MAVPAASSYEVNERRKPRVECQITRAPYMAGFPNRAGVEVTLTRKGVEVSGWYDTWGHIEGFSLTWEEFDALRARLA